MLSIANDITHPLVPRFRALIGLESGAHAEPYYDLDWLHRSNVHGGEVCGAMISGLIAPTAPEADRWETIWHYMQGGPGVFKGDLDVRSRSPLHGWLS